MLQEEVRAQNMLIDNGDLEGVFGPQRAKQKGHCFGTKTRDRGAVGCSERRCLGRELALPVRGWKNGHVGSTIDEKRTLRNVIDNGKGAGNSVDEGAGAYWRPALAFPDPERETRSQLHLSGDKHL